MKCEGLSPEQLAARSVPPSTMSLLGLIRHMAAVENNWFYRNLQGHPDAPRLYWSAENLDLDFDGTVADPAVVADAFTVWREQIAAADQWLDSLTDLAAIVDMADGDQASVRDILIHMIEEYARHCGHADLLRDASTDARGSSTPRQPNGSVPGAFICRVEKARPTPSVVTTCNGTDVPKA